MPQLPCTLCAVSSKLVPADCGTVIRSQVRRRDFTISKQSPFQHRYWPLVLARYFLNALSYSLEVVARGQFFVRACTLVQVVSRIHVFRRPHGYDDFISPCQHPEPSLPQVRFNFNIAFWHPIREQLIRLFIPNKLPHKLLAARVPRSQQTQRLQNVRLAHVRLADEQVELPGLKLDIDQRLETLDMERGDRGGRHMRVKVNGGPTRFPEMPPPGTAGAFRKRGTPPPGTATGFRERGTPPP